VVERPRQRGPRPTPEAIARAEQEWLDRRWQGLLSRPPGLHHWDMSLGVFSGFRFPRGVSTQRGVLWEALDQGDELEDVRLTTTGMVRPSPPRQLRVVVQDVAFLGADGRWRVEEHVITSLQPERPGAERLLEWLRQGGVKLCLPRVQLYTYGDAMVAFRVDPATYRQVERLADY
jgi:hypothetical protein